LVLEKGSYSEESVFGDPMKMANNLLAVVLERENDIACESFSVDLFLEISHRLTALLQRRSRCRSAND